MHFIDGEKEGHIKDPDKSFAYPKYFGDPAEIGLDTNSLYIKEVEWSDGRITEFYIRFNPDYTVVRTLKSHGEAPKKEDFEHRPNSVELGRWDVHKGKLLLQLSERTYLFTQRRTNLIRYVGKVDGDVLTIDRGASSSIYTKSRRFKIQDGDVVHK